MPDERPMTPAEEATQNATVKDDLAAIRSRIEVGIQEDEKALHVLRRIWPSEWEYANFAVVWMLGNAARFGHPYAQDWLDRLVHPDGEPKETNDGIFFDRWDREIHREIGTLLDQLDAALASDDVSTVSNLLTSARLTYLGGYCAGLADRNVRRAF